MGRESAIQSNFNAGELSPLMLARVDVAKRANGLYTCQNFIPLTQGAITRRPGTVHLQQTKFHDRVARLFPFQFSVTQTYILEFGHLYIRFYAAHGVLAATGQNITTVTKTNPAVLTYDGADTYANGDRVYVVDAVGMTQINNREFKVANVSAGSNTFELQDSDGNNVDATGYSTWTSGGTVNEIVEVVTPYSESQTADIRITQSADELYIFHPSYAPRKLVRVTATSWTLSTLAFTDGPYDSVNTTSTTLTPGAATGTTSLTASSTTGINNDTGFAATDVGRLIRYKNGANPWGYMEIVTFGSTTSVDVTIHSTLTAAAASSNWRLGVWSGTTGYPTTGTFFEDRLWMGGASSFPQRIDGSKTGRYTNFSPSSVDGTIAADNGVAFTMNSNDVNRVKWLMDDEKGLVAGTARGEWLIKANTLGEGITPTNVTGKPSTKYGSADFQPVRAGKAILFPQRAGRKLRELAYVFEKDGFAAPDMTVLAEHITSPEMVEMAFQEQPQAVVWVARSDGALLGFSYEREQDVLGWHYHELGGFSDSASTTIPVVESVAVVPAPDATRDEVYMIVQRYVNGGEKRYIEYMSKTWESEDDQLDAVYLDCAFTQIETTPTTTVPGLWHLEGEEVGVYADGAVRPNVTVTNGIATLASAASIITLGYAYNSDAMTLPIEAGSQDGSAQTKIKRINRVGFWLMDTLGIKYGPDFDNLTEIIFRSWGDDAGEATPLFTGALRERFEGDYDKLGQVAWRCDGPFPATVLAVTPQVNTSDDT
jgi:hypothetical protein